MLVLLLQKAVNTEHSPETETCFYLFYFCADVWSNISVTLDPEHFKPPEISPLLFSSGNFWLLLAARVILNPNFHGLKPLTKTNATDLVSSHISERHAPNIPPLKWLHHSLHWWTLQAEYEWWPQDDWSFNLLQTCFTSRTRSEYSHCLFFLSKQSLDAHFSRFTLVSPL